VSPSKHPVAFNVNRFPRGDFDRFSVARYALAKSESRRTGMPGVMKKYAPYETAYYSALESANGRLSMKDYIENPELKAQQISTGQDGGYLAPAEWATDFHDILRSFSVLEPAGAVYQPMDARIAYSARMVADMTEYYVSDNAAITASSVQFAQNTWQPKKQVVIIVASHEVVRDSSPTFDAVLNSAGMQFMAMRRDFQALLGNGQGGTPTGLLNMTNVTTTSLAATPTYANLATGVANVRNLNQSSNVPTGQAECTAVIGGTQLESAMLAMVDTTNARPLWLNGVRGALNVDNWLFSNVIPLGNTGTIFYGHWPSLIIRYRPDVEFMAVTDEESYFAKDEIGIRFTLRYDVACVHPEAFFAHTNAHA
jgi:HK97 family phage major capsid protein